MGWTADPIWVNRCRWPGGNGGKQSYLKIRFRFRHDFPPNGTNLHSSAARHVPFLLSVAISELGVPSVVDEGGLQLMAAVFITFSGASIFLHIVPISAV